MLFGRLITAMVTPFDDNLRVDYAAVERLLDHLFATGTDSVVVAGTTGEAPTLSKEEKLELFRFVVEKARGRGKVIAGTGGNNTAETVKLTQLAEEAGVDGILSVVPYYNKPSQEGLYQHFRAIAESTRLPIILYNIPGRTGINMSAETVVRLSAIDNIVAVKESSGNLSQMATIIEQTPDDFLLYSGDDNLLLPAMAVGAVGVVSVASHVVGREMKEMIETFLTGDVTRAAALHRKLLPLFEGLFMAPNPVPVKAALNMMGIPVGGVRLPLVPLDETQQKKLATLLPRR